MKIWMSHVGRMALVVVIVLAIGIYLGCSKESADTQTTEKPAAMEKQKVAEQEEAAEETASEMVAYANPKKGICPVCGMKVVPEHIQVATIDDNKYACCSAGCVTMLTENPDKYLMPDETE